MTRRNRVDPWGDLHAAAARGLFTGNRGCLVDDTGRVVRHHRSTTLWITCVTSFRGWRHPLDAPHVWTPLFFLDEAVALAAGHRPCAFCRRADYRAYRQAVADGGRPPLAAELDRRLAGERLRRGRGLSRAADRPLWTADVDDAPRRHGRRSTPNDDRPAGRRATLRRSRSTAGPRRRRAGGGAVAVLTPPTSVAALAAGYRLTLHPSAAAGTQLRRISRSPRP